MKRRSLAGLVVLNVALLLVLGVLCLTPQPANAQLGAGGGDYLMIAGRAVGQNAGTLYILDIKTAKLLAINVNKQNGNLEAAAARDINDDVRQGGR